MTTTRPRRSRAKPTDDEIVATVEPEGITADTDELASYPDTGANTPALRAPSLPTDSAGTFALAQMSEDEFLERLATLKRGRDRIATIQRELMEIDVDYGLIPGTPKPTLFKPGAEKLALIYGLAARLENVFVPGDGELQPLLKYESACFLHLGSFGGPIVAVGHGTANGWEKRYRRESDKACPNCGKAALIRSKYEPGWYCFDKKGGCKSKFGPNEPSILEQVTDARGDPVAANDLQNTLLKMSEKRAFVDAVLRATASSSLFTQDVAEEPTEDTATTASGATVNADTGEYLDEYPVPEVRTANVGEVQRGGHRPEVTSAQIDAARALAGSLKLSPWQVADVIADAVGGIDSTMLPEDRAEASKTLLDFMKLMAPDDMGKVVTALRKQSEAK